MAEGLSERQNANLRPPAPKAGALPGCATPRPVPREGGPGNYPTPPRPAHVHAPPDAPPPPRPAAVLGPRAALRLGHDLAERPGWARRRGLGACRRRLRGEHENVHEPADGPRAPPPTTRGSGGKEVGSDDPGREATTTYTARDAAGQPTAGASTSKAAAARSRSRTRTAPERSELQRPVVRLGVPHAVALSGTEPPRTTSRESRTTSNG